MASFKMHSQAQDLFAKDYLILPVYARHHWTLVIICHPGRVVEAGLKGNRSPLLLHLDSLNGTVGHHVAPLIWVTL